MAAMVIIVMLTSSRKSESGGDVGDLPLIGLLWFSTLRRTWYKSGQTELLPPFETVWNSKKIGVDAHSEKREELSSFLAKMRRQRIHFAAKRKCEKQRITQNYSLFFAIAYLQQWSWGWRLSIVVLHRFNNNQFMQRSLSMRSLRRHIHRWSAVLLNTI
jgi:hypothetical protein